jgi:hypothetical protein
MIGDLCARALSGLTTRITFGPPWPGGLRQIRHAHDMNYKNELTIAAIVGDIRASA